MGKFSTVLIDTHALLLNINELEWLVSNCSVAELEDRLPYSERVEWARCMSTVEGASKFEKFKNFLLDRKAITENMASMGCRPVGAGDQDKCGYCSKPGHDENSCLSKKRASGDGPVPRGRGGCAICSSKDH